MNLVYGLVYHKSLTLLILAVHRTHLLHEPSIWPGLPRVSRRESIRLQHTIDRCAEGHSFDSCRGLRFFSLSNAQYMMVRSFYFFTELNIYHHSLFITNKGIISYLFRRGGKAKLFCHLTRVQFLKSKSSRI